MPTFQRATMPEGFYDRTSDMLLVQPEPQFLYAELFLGALGISLVPPSELGVPGRAIGGAGAQYTAADADRLRLASPMFTQVIAASVDFTAQPGNNMRINRPVFANTTYTEASRRVASGTTISTTPITAQSQQTNLTLFRYGGPYDSVNSRVAPFGIERFDANMGVHKAASIFGTHLVRDCHKFVDAVEVTLLDLANTAVYPSGMTALNDATTAGAFPFTFAQLADTEAQMDTANLPTFPDGFRVFVGTPIQLQQLKNDSQYQRAAQFFPAYSILFPQYVASVGKFHIFKSTTLTITANSSSINIHYGHAIAPGALLAGMGGDGLRVVAANEDNYGQTAKVVWLGDLAFGLANNSFVYSVRSSA